MGRPINKKFFGPPESEEPEDTVFAEISYSTNGNSPITTSDITVTIDSPGAFYRQDFLQLINSTSGTGYFTVLASVVNGEVVSVTVASTDSMPQNESGFTLLDNPNYGDSDNDTPSFTITGSANLPDSGPTEVYILKQKSSKKFLVKSKDTGEERICTLAPNIDEVYNFMVEVSPYSNDMLSNPAVEHCKIITSKKVKTFEGNVYFWGELDYNEPGEVLPGVTPSPPDFGPMSLG